jgi:putative transposase
MTIIDALAPEAVAAYRDIILPIPSFTEAIEKGGLDFGFSDWDRDPSLRFSQEDLRNPRIAKILAILREVDEMPRDWTKGKRKWIELIAAKYDVAFQTIYRWMKKYNKKGIAGICHRKNTAGLPKKWHPDALEYWISLCLKREHRKIDKKDLYDILIIEAHRHDWQIGGYESAMWWFEKRATPQLLAIQKGGLRALDNVLPPVLRDYSDLDPFEMLVGDQHRFDFWVVDDETGEVFRPEGYLWQDLRTRIIYGAAIDHKYDSQLIGLALRIGIGVYGAFGSIYTDNGKPELSRYLTGIMSDMRSLNLGWERTIDVTMDVLDMETEDINPNIIIPGTHKKAIVKNAKAKMIEGTFDKLEGILRSRFRLPGSVKRLADDIHHQDIDQKDAKKLAEHGKLPLFSEFALTIYRGCDHYNREKSHRGIVKEWTWKPRVKQATPYDCLNFCYEKDGWRPRMISQRAANLIFLSKAKRKVHLGRIQFQGDHYEDDALVELHGKRVDIRYNTMDTRQVLIFQGSKYLCTAYPVEYSSMKDMTLAQKKIVEKRKLRKKVAEEFRKITSIAPDFREYSQIDPLEKAAALIEGDRKKKAEENHKLYRQRTPEELNAEVAAIEKLNAIPRILGQKPLPERPSFFLTERSRYEWVVTYELSGGTLDAGDKRWMAEYETRMPKKQQEYWKIRKECGL